MRALGPGSVSSFLKIILDVVFIALTIGVGVLALLTLAAVAAVADPGLLDARAAADLKLQGLAGTGLVVALGAACLYVGVVLIIVGRLRRIFATLIAGDPFHPDNVRRLRTIGAMLGVLELGRYPVRRPHRLARPARADRPHPVQSHRLVRGPRRLRASGGVPRGRAPSPRSRTDDLSQSPRPCPSAFASTGFCWNGACR